ncbi:MAG: hypothetical protein QXE79_05760 [Candidatus Bathyarchaeia archaeon]
MGKVARGVKCGIAGCEREAIRSIASGKLDMFEVEPTRSGRVYLCAYHYKEYKKKTRKERIIEKWRHSR